MKPPFSITNTMLNQIVTISQTIGQLSVAYERQLHLRKNHRLRSIQASLAIKNNSLSLEQVSDKLQILSDKLSATELQVFRQIYVYLINRQAQTQAQAQELLDKSAATVRRYLSLFVTKNLLVVVGENKSHFYRLNDEFDDGK